MLVSWLVIHWLRLVVHRFRLMVDWLWLMVNRLRLVIDCLRLVVNRLRLVVDRLRVVVVGLMIDWLWLMVNRLWLFVSWLVVGLWHNSVISDPLWLVTKVLVCEELRHCIMHHVIETLDSWSIGFELVQPCFQNFNFFL